MNILIGAGIFIVICSLFGLVASKKGERGEGALTGGAIGMGCLIWVLMAMFTIFCLAMFILFLKALIF